MKDNYTVPSDGSVNEISMSFMVSAAASTVTGGIAWWDDARIIRVA
jgi:hypothetical protein